VDTPQDANQEASADAVTREIPSIDVIDGELVPRQAGAAPADAPPPRR
jgi:hypothetical protein